MRKAGKRTLAGMAAGALALALVPFVGVTGAQAAQTTVAFCETNNVNGGGIPGDPTSVQPNCVVEAGGDPATSIASFAESANPSGELFTILLENGAGAFVIGDLDVGVTITTVTVNGVPGVAGLTADIFDVNLAGDPNVTLTNPAAGVTTVSILAGASLALVDLTDQGTLTVTATGTASQAVVTQGYYAVDATNATTAAAALAIIHVLDAQGNVVDLENATVTNLTYNTASGTIQDVQYDADDCGADGLLNDLDEGDTAGAGIVTDACALTTGVGVDQVDFSGVWLVWTGPGLPGSYTVTATLTVGAETYPISVNYVVSSTLAGSYTLALDAPSYQLGALAQATISARDLGGRIVPDGLGWEGVLPTLLQRDIAVASNAPIYSAIDGFPIEAANIFLQESSSGDAGTTSVVTYNGSTPFGLFFVPPTPMAQFALTTEAIEGDGGLGSVQGWAAATLGETAVATATIGDPEPVEASIMIVGDRLNKRQVFVEGNTENLAGSAVTPYFRFPGQVGFTMGTGTRTVAADETFTWQRKTGKKIAVQFRFGDVRSNTVIIQGR